MHHTQSCALTRPFAEDSTVLTPELAAVGVPVLSEPGASALNAAYGHCERL
ncbi:MAG: hypothetical protein ABSH04_02450 [Acidimicrobiales bacterium]|jgi:hypothetical protein